MARRNVTYEPLSDAQTAALAAYQEWAGEGWKLRLAADWMRERSNWRPCGILDFTMLYRLRSSHGPMWLMEFI